MAEIEIKKLSKKQSKKSGSELAGSLQSLLTKDISFGRSKISDKKKEEFYHELAVLISAGIDIKTALELVIEGETGKKSKIIFESIYKSVVKGKSLSDAMAAENEFTQYEIFTIAIGEETGKLSKVVEELAYYFKTRIKQKRQAISALSYPAIVLLTSMGVTLFMLNVIVPMFADVFKRFGGELPFITRLVITASNFVSDYFLYGIISIIAAVFFVKKNKNKVWFRKFSSSILLKLPIIGELIRKIYLARFCSILHLLLGAKIPLLRGLGLIKHMISFFPLEIAIDQVEKKILKGMPLHDALSEHAIFHKKMVSLVKVGEEINKMEEFFERISKQYEEEIEHQSKILTTLIEPLMMIFLGLVVGIILVSMYLPMFKLNNFF